MNSVGYPRMGPKGELKTALEAFWYGKISAADLEAVAKGMRASIWKQKKSAGVKLIPSNTFSYYDQFLDTTAMLGAVPPRYRFAGGEIDLVIYFSMARGNAMLPAMENKTKWFDTNYHYVVPELGPEVKFAYSSHKAVEEYKEAKELGIDTVPVVVGPVSYLLLSEPATGVAKTFNLLSLLDVILPIYKQVVGELVAAGATWIQFDEPSLIMDLKAHQLEAFSNAYCYLEGPSLGANLVVGTCFANIPVESYTTITGLKSISGIRFGLIPGPKSLSLFKEMCFPADKILFAGQLDGRNIWANDSSSSLSNLESLKSIVRKDKPDLSTSSSLMQTAVGLENETKSDSEIKSWLDAFTKIVAVVGLLAEMLASLTKMVAAAKSLLTQFY